MAALVFRYIRYNCGSCNYWSSFSGNLYGKLLTVFPLHYLRQEQKFKDLAALRTAMEADAAAAKEVLKQDEQSNETAGQSSLL